MESALYFPHIRVPQSSWFNSVLLYWDSAAAIVPLNLAHDPNALGPYMTDLVAAKLLRLIHPDDKLWERPDYAARFRELLTSYESEVSAQPTGKWAKMHSSKIDAEIFHELEQKGFARAPHGPEYETWWEVDQGVAQLYMAYLAGAISGLYANLFPVTDSEQAIAALASPTGAMHDRLRDLRYNVVVDALPVPSKPLDAAEIADFKRKHQDELTRLRTYLDARLVDLAQIDDQQVRQVKKAQIVLEISDDVAKLQERMKKRNWPKIALVSIGGVVGASLMLAGTIATGGGALALGLAVGGGFSTLGSASYTAAEIIQAPRFDATSPFVYSALIAQL